MLNIHQLYVLKNYVLQKQNKMIKKIIILTLTFSLAISAFFLFKPFNYIDNDQSAVLCDNGGIFNIGPNYIYSFEDRLDSFNGIKARKLCQFNAIRDYNDTYKSPETINYQFKPIFSQDSSWPDALLMASAVILAAWLLIGFFVKKDLKNYFSFKYIFISFLLGTAVYFVVLRQPTINLYCQRQVAQKVVNFRNSAFKYGVLSVPEEDKHIKEITPEIFQKCFRSEF